MSPDHAVIDFQQLGAVPPVVAAYFRRALTEGQADIHHATYEQRGRLRTGTRSNFWMTFTAHQDVDAFKRSFTWNARIRAAGIPFLEVTDQYADAKAHGRVRLFSRWTIGSDEDTPELNSGALHRYLAEAVWCPTALLPSHGVRWQAIDDRRAIATLRDRSNEVSLEFSFDDEARVTKIFSPGRWGSFDGGYRQVPWEGRFAGELKVQGVRVPACGEVGWYDGDQWAAVWQGEFTHIHYRFARADADPN